jgi:hypothetical protein
LTAPAWYCQWTGCGRDTLFGDFVHPWGPERIADGFLPVLALLDDHSIEIGAVAERWSPEGGSRLPSSASSLSCTTGCGNARLLESGCYVFCFAFSVLLTAWRTVLPKRELSSAKPPQPEIASSASSTSSDEMSFDRTCMASSKNM